ncbi:MAG: flagellar motor switch protein FliM, partial [Fimbriimonadaceae bacterium]
MSDVLSKAEIESLIGTLASEAEGEPLRRPSQGQEKPQRTRGVVAYEVYDFRRPDKFSKEQLRTLQMLNEGFGRLAGSSLAANLRLPVSFELVALEQVPYEEYLRGIS